MRKKILTPELKETIIKKLKEGKKPGDIATELGIKRQAMALYARDYRHLYYHKCNSEYFNVDLYAKLIHTI